MKQLSQQSKIPANKGFGKLPLFRDFKEIRAEPVTEDKLTYHIHLNLDEMKNKTSFVFWDCSDEPDQIEMEKLLRLSDT